MKKFITVTSSVALLAMSVLPALAQTNVNTGFTRSTAGGDPPVIKVKWEMYTGTQGLDELSTSSAQFLPSGQYNVDTHIEYCAVATDPDGLSDVNAVYADVFYPLVRTSHNTCDEQVGDEILLTKLSKADGWNLLCDSIKNHNNNLPTWAQGYDYDEVCANDGELQKETAAVYCGARDLSYEAPAGNYTVKVHAADKAGLDSAVLENEFTYLPVTAFETDFTSVSYGNVKLNTHKIVNGDLTFGTSNLPTVRNVGNTLMTLLVKQDDMGLGSTNGTSNVHWDGRVGSDATFSLYEPNIWEPLENMLQLSETDEVDFSILVDKFPLGTGLDGAYTGTMWLDAQTNEFEVCIQE